MKRVLLKTPLEVVDEGGKRTRAISVVTEAVADWSWVAPSCLQIVWWGSAEAKRAGNEASARGEAPTATVYVIPSTSVKQIELPDMPIRKTPQPSGLVVPR